MSNFVPVRPINVEIFYRISKKNLTAGGLLEENDKKNDIKSGFILWVP